MPFNHTTRDIKQVINIIFWPKLTTKAQPISRFHGRDADRVMVFREMGSFP